MRRCAVTGKRKFASALDAMIRFADMPKTGRAYRCEFCGLWHVTSQPKRSKVES